MILLTHIATYRDGGSKVYRDKNGNRYWENYKITDRKTIDFGKLFCGELGNKVLAKGLYKTDTGLIFDQ